MGADPESHLRREGNTLTLGIHVQTVDAKERRRFESSTENENSEPSHPTLWPTATSDSVGAGNRNLAGSKAHAGNSLTDVVRGGQAPRWTTPQAQDSKQHNCPPASRDRDLLAVEVVRWPSPVATEARQGYQDRTRGKKGTQESLTTVAVNVEQKWPTPAVPNGGRSVPAGAMSWTGATSDGKKRQVELSSAVKWPTPAASTGDSEPHGLDGGAGARSMLPDEMKRSSGSLNPDWVELLMGWPAGWSSLEPLEYLDWPAAHGAWPAPPGPQHEWEPPRVAVGVKDRVKRLKALGNGQVPATAAMAWRVLS